MKACSTVFAMFYGIVFAGFLCQVSGHLIKENEMNENDESKEAEQYINSVYEFIKNRFKHYRFQTNSNATNPHTYNVRVHLTPLNEKMYLKLKKKPDERMKRIIENASSVHPTLVNYNNISSTTIARNGSLIHPSVLHHITNNIFKIIARNFSTNYPVHSNKSTVFVNVRTKRKNGNIFSKRIALNDTHSMVEMLKHLPNILKTIAKNVSSPQSTTLVNNLILKINAKEDNNSMLSTHFNDSALIRVARNVNFTHPTQANNSINGTHFFHQTLASNLSRSDQGYFYRVQNHTELKELPYITLVAICTFVISTLIIIGLECLFSNNTVLTEDKETSFKTLIEFYSLEAQNFDISHVQLKLWRRKICRTNIVPKSALQALAQCDAKIFPNIFKIIKILCTLPVSTTTPERTFSSLKRVKTYLRNTMCEDRLNGLAMLAVHKNVDFDTEEVINELVRRPRKINLVL